MLDCDASFVSVPEFASIRRSLPARLKAATALPDGSAEAAIATGSCSGHKAERQSGETFTSAMRPAFIDHVPAFDMPPIPVPPLADLRAEAAHSFAPAETDEAGTGDLAPAETEAEPRPVTPRRPLRFTAARSADDAAPVSLPSFNLFDGVFEDAALDGPGIDPRLQRSRARALARLAAVEATLTPVERNLWHDDDEAEAVAPSVLARTAPVEADATPAEAAAPRAEGAIAPRRPVRQLSPSDMNRTPRPQPQPQIHDPLRDRLRDLRDILYTPSPEEAAAAALAAAQPQRQPLPQRALAMLLPLVALLAGLIVTALQAVRGLASRMAQPLPKAPAWSLSAFGRARRMVAGLPTGLAPRIGMAAAALAALAVPIGLTVPPDLLPFL